MKKEDPRGIRNNNPGNIELNATPWQGLADKQTDGRFAQFNGPAWGIRALATTLITYQDKHKIRTIQGIINRWAPPHENDTNSYSSAVARIVGVSPTAQIDVHQHHILQPLVEAIIRHENGAGPLANTNTWYDITVINEGLRMAGVVAVPTSTISTKEGIATATTAAAGGTALIAELVSQVSPALSQVRTATEATNGLPQWLRVVIIAGTLVAVAASVYLFMRKRKQVVALDQQVVEPQQ